jgi:hypothetical protein
VVKTILTKINSVPSVVHVLSALQHHGVSWAETRIVRISGLPQSAVISSDLGHMGKARIRAPGQCDGRLLCYICVGDGAAGILPSRYIEVAASRGELEVYDVSPARDRDWKERRRQMIGGFEERRPIFFFCLRCMYASGFRG